MGSTPPPATRPGTATVIRGGAIGVLAFLLGYLLTYATAAGALTRALRGFDGGGVGWEFAPEWKAVAWLFYDAHLVGTGGPAVSGLFDLVTLAGVQYLYVLPPLLLVVSGALTARLAGAVSPRSGFLAGVTVATGYLLAVAVGLPLVGFAGIAPSPVRALVVAGLVYPVAFGALGGVLTGVLGAERQEGTAGSEHARTP